MNNCYTKICPFTSTECDQDKCGLVRGGDQIKKCVFELAERALLEIAGSLKIIARQYEIENNVIETFCPFNKDKEELCFDCDCFDRDNGCCKFAGQKTLINNLYEKAFSGLFKDSTAKEE